MKGPRVALHWSVDVSRIERARVLRAWTRGHLAGMAHVDPKTLNDMLNCRRQPRFVTLHAICEALDLAIEDLIVFDADTRAVGQRDCADDAE